jgi:hypothetical protein
MSTGNQVPTKRFNKKNCVQNSVATKFYAQNGLASKLFLQKVGNQTLATKFCLQNSLATKFCLQFWQRVYAPFFYHKKPGPDPVTVHIKSVGVIARIQQLFFRQPNFRYKTKFGHPLFMSQSWASGNQELVTPQCATKLCHPCSSHRMGRIPPQCLYKMGRGRVLW